MKFKALIILLSIATLSFAQTKEKYQKYADSLIKIGQKEQLIKYFEKELKSKPKNEDVLRWLGFLNIDKNNLELGEKYYNDALAVNPNCARCYMNIGKIYSLKNDNKKALQFLDKAIVADSKDALIYAYRANLKEFINDKFGALFDYNKAIELEPKNYEFYIQRGIYNSNQGYFSIALSDLTKAIELEPKNFNTYFNRSSLYYGKRMTKEALDDITKAIQLDSTQSILYNGRGAVYSVLGETEKSISDYNKAIKLNPNDYLTYYNRSNERYKLEDMEGYASDILACYSAIKNFDPTETIKSENYPEMSLKAELEYLIGIYCDSSKASYYYQRGIAFYNLGQYDKAVDVYTKGLKKFPTNAMSLSFRGNAYYMLKNYENALTDYSQSVQNKENLISDIEINQKHTQLTNEYEKKNYTDGFLASMQTSIAEIKFAQGKYDEALIEINKGIAIAPEIKVLGKENYYNVRGNIFIALGKYHEAINDFDMCIKLNSNFSLAYVNRAVSKINLAKEFKMSATSISGGINDKSFTTKWALPNKISAKKSDTNILSALNDCNKAIDIDAKFDYAYYIRGHVKKILSSNDYCYDFLKSKELGYPLELPILNECIK